ncbi:MAG TPA: phospholipid carrier-dependent glycosyltransferase, partial [Thermoanaerobaculia bacterium]|nr:phospholipid carrier-dependent glycosyltransferase [Thermoanaerobaculia bacterium]
MLKVWLAVVVVAIGLRLGGPPLLDADEGRNAEVGREMAATNDYVMPRLNGLPYLDKPVVYFAAEAAFMEVLGPTELAARLPAYLFTLATAAVLFWFARRAGYDPWVTTIVFLTMPLVVAFARTVIFDSALMFFVVVALAAFWCAVEERNARWSWLAWAAMGFTMITKGPVTFVLVLF